MIIDIEYINKDCKLQKGSDGAVAFDVRANITEPIELYPGKACSVPLGFRVDTKESEIGMFLFMRSGLAAKHGLMLMNSVGVIDSDYRGECIAKIWNTGVSGEDKYVIQPNERIGQVIFLKAVPIEINEVEKISESERSLNGFGSTGRM